MCYNLFADEESKDIFRSIIDFRVSLDYQKLKLPSKETQYFDKTIPITNPNIFVDCGAYNGDTIQSLNETYGTISEIFAFEPEINNFKILCSYVSEHKDSIAKKVVLYPCGLWSTTISLSFNS